MGEFYIKQPDELYHYGVRGMKWGVRKQRETVGRQQSSQDAHYQRQQRRRSNIRKAAIGAATIAAVAGVSYVAIKKGKAKQVKAGINALQKSGVTINSRKLTGHSQKLTRHGANVHQEQFYRQRWESAGKAGNIDAARRYGARQQAASKRLTDDWYKGRSATTSSKPTRKLRRKSFSPQTFNPSYVGYTVNDGSGTRKRVYGNRLYKMR